MGHIEVFSHVGDQVRIQAPNGKYVAPLVTGTFGSSDFTHSLLGGAGYSFICFILWGFALLTLSIFFVCRGG
jgi:heterokaryon incompatibility protein Het-C